MKSGTTPAGLPSSPSSLPQTNPSIAEQQQHTEWHKIQAWGKMEQVCGEYLAKSRLAYIEGSIRSRQWGDQSGNKRTSYEIIPHNMQMLDSRADYERGTNPPIAASGKRHDSGSEPSLSDKIVVDDIPF